MRALGPQGTRALREPAPDIRLVTDTPSPSPSDGLPSGWQPLGITDEARAALQAAEVERLRARVAELEVEVEHLRRQIDAAREAGQRDERAVTARTMGGRLPSILTRRTR